MSPPSAHHFILATAGHVDHGKSSLIKALTGIDPDRLPEEKARGITIDLGFAHLELTHVDSAGASSRFQCGIVDVPGHEDFVKNMVAGVGSIDLALLIVAADDGWMPQTEEHVQILSYLGVKRAVVVLTRIDLAPDESSAANAVRENLVGTPFADAPIVATSVVTGQGLEDLKVAVGNILATTPVRKDTGKPRLPVDRVFVLRGIGTVVTGTLIGGNFSCGQSVVVQPGNRATRIRSMQSHDQDLTTALPGSRTALNLHDMAVAKIADAPAHEGIRRGEVVTVAELGEASRTINVVTEKSARLIDSRSAASRPLKDGARVRLHHGSGNVAARIFLRSQKQLEPGASAIGQIRMESPLFVFVGDHFVIRDWSAQNTLAGGIVLEIQADRKKFRAAEQERFLGDRAAAPTDPFVFLRTQMERDRVARTAELLIQSRFAQAEINTALAQLISDGEAISAGEFVVEASCWNGLREKAIAAIELEHEQHPDRAGLLINRLSALLTDEVPRPEILDFVMADLGRSGFMHGGTTIRRESFHPALPANLQAAGKKIRCLLAGRPLEPPSRKELAPDASSQQALRFLLLNGEAMEISKDVVLLTEQWLRASQRVRDFLRERGPATVSEIRQTLGSSRRIVVPLLEKMDREGLTRRDGDRRVLGRQK